MKLLPIIISLVIIGAVILFFQEAPGIFQIEKISEDNLTLLRCTGDRFAFIQGTYLNPVTEEEIAAERDAVILKVKDIDGHEFLSRGDGGGGPGESRIVAWGYCIDYDGVPSGFRYAMGNDAPSKNALEKSNRWYQEKIVNRTLEKNSTCTSRTVVERFQFTGMELIRVS